jgi:hypothetical protein
VPRKLSMATPTVRITRAQDQGRDDLRWWLSRPPEERIAAVEQLRREHHQVKEGGAEPRLQRVCRVVQRATGRTRDCADLEALDDGDQ